MSSVYDAESIAEQPTADQPIADQLEEPVIDDRAMADPAGVSEVTEETLDSPAVDSPALDLEETEGGETDGEAEGADAVAAKAKDNRNWFVVHTYSGYENKVRPHRNPHRRKRETRQGKIARRSAGASQEGTRASGRTHSPYPGRQGGFFRSLGPRKHPPSERSLVSALGQENIRRTKS
jgi:hypothetical protein